MHVKQYCLQVALSAHVLCHNGFSPLHRFSAPLVHGVWQSVHRFAPSLMHDFLLGGLVHLSSDDGLLHV